MVRGWVGLEPRNLTADLAFSRKTKGTKLIAVDPRRTPLAASAEWLVCDDVCIPEEGKFALDLPVAAAAQPANAETRALFDKARRDVPTTSPWPARFARAPNGDSVLVIDAKGLKPETIRDVYFFPAEWGPVAHMARQSARVSADGIRIPLKKGEAANAKEGGKGGAPPQQLIGTLALTEKTADGEHRQAFDLTAKFDPMASALADGGAGEASLSLVEALLFALLGGLILNLMPCVFPVLAMKAASFARLAGQSRADLRRDGVAYTAGVLVSFAAMAVALLAIRSSVGDVSWGIQFQSPIFSLLIAYLFFAVGLNLSGVFEVGGRFAGVGQSLAARGEVDGARRRHAEARGHGGGPGRGPARGSAPAPPPRMGTARRRPGFGPASCRQCRRCAGPPRLPAPPPAPSRRCRPTPRWPCQ